MDGHGADRSSEWPLHGLDPTALRSTGWRPTPFRQVILKIHSRCNLSCDYCYLYTMGDTTWRDVPRVMAPATLAAACGRIAEHVQSHRLEQVEVVLHGGEPLLAGAATLNAAAGAVRAAVPAGCTVRLALQTNGVLLDEAILAVLRRHGIRVGISLDGPPEANDRHRVDARGRGSYAAVARALRILNHEDNAGLFAGILCAIDVHSDPVATYEALVRHSPPAVDFLLPHGNWSAPPPLRGPASAGTPYGAWLAAVFDRWYGAARPETGVRLFEQILTGVLGGRSSSESVGLSPVALLVVDTAGRLEQVDTLRSAHDGAAATGLDVFRHAFDAALGHPGVVARQIGRAALHEDCRACPVREVCGGGFYPHRYHTGSGYRNPSVYCPDLEFLIRHVAGRVERDLRALTSGEA